MASKKKTDGTQWREVTKLSKKEVWAWQKRPALPFAGRNLLVLGREGQEMRWNDPHSPSHVASLKVEELKSFGVPLETLKGRKDPGRNYPTRLRGMPN